MRDLYKKTPKIQLNFLLYDFIKQKQKSLNTQTKLSKSYDSMAVRVEDWD